MLVGGVPLTPSDRSRSMDRPVLLKSRKVYSRPDRRRIGEHV